MSIKTATNQTPTNILGVPDAKIAFVPIAMPVIIMPPEKTTIFVSILSVSIMDKRIIPLAIPSTRVPIAVNNSMSLKAYFKLDIFFPLFNYFDLIDMQVPDAGAGNSAIT